MCFFLSFCKKLFYSFLLTVCMAYPCLYLNFIEARGGGLELDHPSPQFYFNLVIKLLFGGGIVGFVTSWVTGYFGLQIIWKQIQKIRRVPPSWLAVLLGWLVGIMILHTINWQSLILLLVPPITMLLSSKRGGSSKKKNHKDKSDDGLFLRKLNLLWEQISSSKIDMLDKIEDFSLEYMDPWLTCEFPISDEKEDLCSFSSIAKQYSKMIKDSKEDNAGREDGIRLAITGEHGTGKSSMINLILNNLKDCENLVVCQISLWGYSSSLDAERAILEKVVDSLSQEVCVSQIRSVSKDWQKIMKWAPDGWWKWLLSLFEQNRSRSPSELIVGLANLLQVSQLRLLLVIEDVDRNNFNKRYHAREVQSLLEQLKQYLQEENVPCSMIVAGDNAYNNSIHTMDYSRLCEYRLDLPQISLYSLKKILCILIMRFLPEIDLLRDPNFKFFSLNYGDEHSLNSMGASAGTLECLTAFDICKLLRTTRNLKVFIRDLVSRWKSLKGEVDFLDLMFFCLLNTVKPELINLLQWNSELLRGDYYKDSESTTSKEALKASYKKIIEEKPEAFHILDKIVIHLFGKKAAKLLGIDFYEIRDGWHNRKRQRLHCMPFPTDYWKRAYNGVLSLGVDELTDTKIKEVHESWRKDPSSDTELIKILRNPWTEYKWVSLELDLTEDEIFELSREVIVDRSIDSKGKLQAVNFYPSLENTFDTALSYLMIKVDELKNDSRFLPWALEMTRLLITQNLFTATALYIRIKPTNGDGDVSFTDIQSVLMKTLKALLVSSEVSSIKLMDLIPAYCPSVLKKYIKALEEGGNVVSVDLTRWLCDPILDGLKIPDAKAKSIEQFLGICFNYTPLPLHEREKSITLDGGRAINIFGERRFKDSLKLVLELDFSKTCYNRGIEEKIKCQIREYLKK